MRSRIFCRQASCLNNSVHIAFAPQSSGGFAQSPALPASGKIRDGDTVKNLRHCSTAEGGGATAIPGTARSSPPPVWIPGTYDV